MDESYRRFSEESDPGGRSRIKKQDPIGPVIGRLVRVAVHQAINVVKFRKNTALQSMG